MSATVCAVNPPGHDWQNGLTCDWCWETRTVTEAILSQLSSRRGGTPADARKLLDAYRAEVLAEDGQAYDGELAMLHGLIATLTAVAHHGDIGDVRKLLKEHKADHTQALAETGEPTAREQRLAQLLDTIRTHRGEWRVGRVQKLRRHTRGNPNRTVARQDLHELHQRGHLTQHGPQDGRFYTLNTRKDGAE